MNRIAIKHLSDKVDTSRCIDSSRLITSYCHEGQFESLQTLLEYPEVDIAGNGFWAAAPKHPAKHRSSAPVGRCPSHHHIQHALT